MSGHALDRGMLASQLVPNTAEERHAAALTVVERVPLEDAARVLDMLGLRDVR